MIFNSRLFWHEFRHAMPLRAVAFFGVVSLVCAAAFLHAASPETTKEVWSGFTAMPIGMVCGLAIVTIMAINPRNPATLNKTLPTPFGTLIAGRLSAVFLGMVFLPWAFLTGAMAMKFPGGFLPTSAMVFVILWLCFWGFTFFGTLVGESAKEALRHAALTGAAGFGPMLLYAGVRSFVARDAWAQNHAEDAKLNMLIILGVFSVILPLLCVSAWRMPFRKVRFRWYGPVVLMIAPLILCVPTARMISSLAPHRGGVTAPRIIASFPADEGGIVRADNFIATISPVYSDGKDSVEVEMNTVALSSPIFPAYRNVRVVLLSEESKRFVVLQSNMMSGRGTPLLSHDATRFFLSGTYAQKAVGLIRPRILLLSGDRFSYHLMSGSTDEHRIPECFAFPPPQPISEDISVPAVPPSAE